MPERRRTAPTPRPRPDPKVEVDARKARALEEPLDARLRARAPYPLLEVRNPLHGTVYLVMLPEFPLREAELCTCTDFARRGLGTCKHIEAAYRWLDEHPEAEAIRARTTPGPSPAAVWREIDRRLASVPGDRRPTSLAWRRPGATLIEGVGRAR